MRKVSKIVDNPTIKEVIDQIQTLDNIESLTHLFPFFKKLFPKLGSVSSDISKLKEQVLILLIPDQFNELFSQHGWIAYGNMDVDVMKTAIDLHESENLERAEEYLADSYNEETLRWGILRFNGNDDFRKRIRLVELAREDYMNNRYHACIPLLLSLLDGLVNDVSKHVGFFAENIDLTAWDSIAGHETGLQTLAQIFTKGRNKTNENPIFIPYRNGILHGRELAFDNKVVAAKCWAAIFATRDWADELANGKKEPKLKSDVSWKQVITQLSETSHLRKAVKEWKARINNDISYLPFEGEIANLPKNTPEWAVAVFLEHWCNMRFGPIADALLSYTKEPKGKKAGMARQSFGRYIPTSFKILSIDDQAAAVTNVITELYFENDGKKIRKEVSVRAIYQDLENNPSVRSIPDGYWRIDQNSFAQIIYATSL